MAFDEEYGHDSGESPDIDRRANSFSIAIALPLIRRGRSIRKNGKSIVLKKNRRRGLFIDR
jgi:hypothetical protein